MDIGFNFSDIETFGCVVIFEEIPHLYIMDKGELLDGIPFFDDNEIYLSLDEDELIIVGITIKDSKGDDLLDMRLIDDDNYDEMTYVVTPLKFYTLKTPGLINDDIIDLGFFDVLVQNLIDGYLENLRLKPF